MVSCKVALVDDHPTFCDGLVLYIRRRYPKIKITIVAFSGQELLNKLADGKHEMPDVIITDIQMNKMSGVELTRIVKQRFPKLNILGMTSFESPNDIFEMLDAGAKGYFFKSDATEELGIAIEAVKNGGLFFSQSALRVFADKQLRAEHEANRESFLTAREAEFVKLCCSDDGYKEIAGKMGITVRSLEDYRDSVYKKLNVRTRPGLIVSAYSLGLNKGR